ncbi:hypothetical protein BDV93DRAFT_611557 [Ceratobasidium sp. AG-I]|nr:hypothetical protein BDV93DRAFT_611557 [Ceratobasidium sp. AG-I]
MLKAADPLPLPLQQMARDIPLSVWEMKHDFYHETHSTMVKLTQLRRLSINMYLTGHETLTAIAGLPNLEHLAIGSTHQEDVFMSLPEPAEGLFPKLRYLALHHISYEDMITALSTEYLLRGLTSLDLVVDPKPIFEDAAQWAWDAFHWGILEENLRQATRLRICFDSVTDDASCVKISEYNMEQLEKIPLRYIFLRKARLDDGDIEGHPFELLVRTWPNITHIHLPDQPANIEDLVYFLSLPHLCHLTLNLNIRPVGNPAPSLHASGPESFKILECSKASCGEEFEPAQVGEIAGQVVSSLAVAMGNFDLAK